MLATIHITLACEEENMKWYKIYELDSDGRRGACVFDCRAESIEDAYNQVSRQSWPFGLAIVGDNESRTFAGNNPHYPSL